MFRFLLIIILLLEGFLAAAQSNELRVLKFKGGYADGQVRSDYEIVIRRFTYPVRVCVGENAVFRVDYEGTLAYRLAWRKIGESKIYSDSTCFILPDVKIADRGEYYCQITDLKSGKFICSDTVELKIKKTPVISISDPVSPVTICYGKTIDLDGGATETGKESGDLYSYSWQGKGIVGVTNQQRITVAPEKSTTYILTVNNDGCRAIDSVSVLVNRPVVELPAYINSSEGSRLEIKAVVVPEGGQLAWMVGNVAYPNVNPLVIPSVPGDVQVSVSLDAGGCFAEDTCMVFARRGVSFKGDQGDGFERSAHEVHLKKIIAPTSVCEQADAVFALEYEGTLVYDFKWKKVGSDILFGDSSVLTLKKVTLENRGKYYCEVSDIQSGKITYSDTVDLKVVKRPVAVIGNPVSPKMICYGDTITLNATASDAGKEPGDTYSYSWAGDGIVGSSNLPVVKVGPTSSVTYVVSVNNAGCVAQASVQVVVYRPQVDLPEYVYISEGNTLELKADVPAEAKLIWNADGNVFEDINPFVYPDIRKTMEVSVKMVNEGCEAEDKCKVYVKRGRGYQGGEQDGFDVTCRPPVILSQDRSVASCVASDAEMKVEAEGSKIEYIWQKFSDETKKFEDYTGSAGSHVKGIGTYRLQFTPLEMEDNGMYICKLKNDCGEVVSDTFFLSVGGRPVVKSWLNKEWGQCVDSRDSIHLNVVAVDPLGKDLSYSWYRIDTTTKAYLKLSPEGYNKPYWKQLLNNKALHEGIYLVDIYNECGHTRDSVFIPVNLPVQITGLGKLEAGNILRACRGQQAEFSVETIGGGKMKYRLMRITKLWSQYPLKYDAEYVGGGSSKYILRNLTTAQEGNYVWEVDNGCGKDTSDLISLRVEVPPVITAQSADTTVCADFRTRLTLNCEADAGWSTLTYRWFKNGVQIAGSGSAYTINGVREADAGNYVCIVNNTCPAIESRPIKVQVKDKPVVLSRPYIRESYCAGDTVKLDVELGTTMAVDSIRWYFNNKSLYDIENKIVGTTTRGLKLNGVAVTGDGYYQIRAYNGCGENVSEPVYLKVDRPAEFTKDLSGYTNLVLCDGETQSLTVATSGTAPIRYIWTHNGDVTVDGFSNTLLLKNVTADTAGLYCCEIQNRCGGKVVCAEIKVSRPDTFRFELRSANGKICAGDPDGLTAVLMGSDTLTRYDLYREPAQLVTSVHGRDIRPYGGFIEFNGLMGGTYYIKGVDALGCGYRMPGTAVITENPQPVKFKTFIARQLCKDQRMATVGVDGSEKNIAVEYNLQKLDGAVWKPYLEKRRGTGDTILWTEIPEGSYKITARNTENGCGVDMTGIVEVVERELPLSFALLAKNNDTVYCAGAVSDVSLKLSGMEIGTKYALVKMDGTVYRKGAYLSEWENVESGVYKVNAENQWGCSVSMGNRNVRTQAAPARTSITGGFIFCKDQRGTGRIEMKDTRAGILYKMYRELPKTLYLDTMGVGGSIIVQVPLENKQYYVIAEDTTREHCRTNLLDTALFRMSTLEIAGNPAEYYRPSGVTTDLSTIIRNAEGEVIISWMPADKLQTGQSGLQNPTTVALTDRVDFRVEAKDKSGCIATTAVSVIMTSGKLACDIRETDRVTSPDTVRACAGVDIDMYAWVNGGTGVYQYAWKDQNGREVGNTQTLRGYSRTTDGYLVLQVTSGEITEKDSVWVDVYDSPASFNMLPSGLVCTQKSPPVEITLDGSQNGMKYILSYSSDNSRYNEIDTIDAGGDVTFTLADGYHQEGYYTIRAEYFQGVINCVTEMSGTVELRKGADRFALDGDKTYCAGSVAGDSLVLSGSQQGITYTLYRRPATYVAEQTGTGGKLLFTGDFGSGNYYVTGTNGVCQDSMLNPVDILRNPVAKELRLPEAGSYCEGACPDRITLNPAEAGVTYILKRKNFGQEDAVVEILSGTGKLTFARHCEAGEYYVAAVNGIGCERIFTDRIKISSALTQVNVTSGAVYCDSETGYAGLLQIPNPQDGVTYKLYAEKDGRIAGTFDSLAVDGLFYRGVLEAGTYKVVASAGTCSLDIDQKVVIRKQSLPEGNDIVPPYTLCQGDGVLEMGIATTGGLNYTLYRDSSGVVTRLKNVPGTDGIVSLGSYYKIGSYYVVAAHSALGCEWRLKQEYRIDKSLQEFGITGDSLYCAVDGGVVVGVDSTEKQVDYVLQKWDEGKSVYQDVDKLTGKGVPVAFKGYFPAGLYRVKAVRGCEKIMKGILKVRSKAMPSDSTVVDLIGNGCVDSAVILRLKKTETDVKYTLYHDNDKVGTTLAGTGGVMNWDIAPAVLGTYKIIADKDDCMLTLPGTVEIGERPFVSPLQGDSVLCANLFGEVYAETWDNGAVYTLRDHISGTVVATGAPSGGRLWFASVPVGTFYAVAARGNCQIKGEEYTIDSIAVPILGDDFWTVSECVKRGEGMIAISGMADTLRYLLSNSSGELLLDYRGVKPDTTFSGMESDRYCIKAVNERSGCASDDRCAEIRESVSEDALTGDFSYCDSVGVTLRLSGSTRNMKYQMKTLEGDVIEEIVFSATQFRKKYKEGTYLFRKERTGFMGGCFTEDTVRIHKYNYPDIDLDVEILGGGTILCEEQHYQVQLKRTEPDFRYMLVRDAGSATQQYIDTVMGDGGVRQFAKAMTRKGFYKIYAEPAGGMCGRFLDTTFRIYPAPRPVTADTCSYCYQTGFPVTADSCALRIRGLINGVMYVLDNGTRLDTLYGPGTGVFIPQPAGRYYIMAEDLPTGCRDTVAVTEIKAHKGPQLFSVGQVCAAAGEIGTVDGSQGDTVTYYLYKDGVQIAGPLSGTGGNISFGTYSGIGIYKIKAVTAWGCEAWMKDSAVIYEPLKAGVLSSEGRYCALGSTGVAVIYTGSSYGWNYFLKKGMWTTDTLTGGADKLKWDKIDGTRIISKGTYDLYAYNACEVRLVTSIQVQENPLPGNFRIKGADAAICKGTGLDLVLAGSENGVSYQLMFVKNGVEQLLKTASGTGADVSLGNYSAVGQYIVYGVVDSSGCRAKMDEKMFFPGSTPDLKSVSGRDVCLGLNEPATVTLCMNEPLQAGVKYYLEYKQGMGSFNRDTLEAGMGRTCFTVQKDTGCYQVIAEDAASHCRNNMQGLYCIGLPPVKQELVKTDDTVKLCRGEKHCIRINGSEVGVKYVLLRDGLPYKQPVPGEGWAIEVGCAEESGVYKVKAFTGDCYEIMNDSIVVVVNELPGMILKREYSYCEYGAGVQIGVSYPTDTLFEYKLYAPGGTLEQTRSGRLDRSGFVFDGSYTDGGYYHITVVNAAGCTRHDSVEVTVNELPQPFRLNTTNGKYLCVADQVQLFLDSSQLNVEYCLYRKNSGSTDQLIGRKYGTGKELVVATLKTSGEYYVEATDVLTSCKNNMYSSFVLHQADTVRVYRLEGLRTGYCYTDAGKGSLHLLKSQTGVEYELFRDGRSTGFVQYGTGGELRWLSVDGKPCSNRIGMEDVGYIYELLARDTATGCEAWMNGKVGIVEETDPVIEAWHPNKDILRCAGQPVNFNISAVGCNLHYRWQKDGVVLKDTTEGFYNIERVGAADFGRYICEVSNSCGSTVMPEVLLKVRDTLEYLRRMEDLALCGNSGGDAVLNGYILNGTSHEWYRAGDEGNILGVDSWYKIRGAQPSDAGTYVYRSSNECGSLTDTCVLRIDREPILDAVISRTDTVCRGSSYLLHVESSDHIRWYRDGVFTGVSGKDMILNPVRLADQGHYTVRVGNACGEKITDVARLYVDDTIRLLSLRPSEVVCEGAVVDLYVRTSPTDRVSYVWERAGVVLARDRSTYRVGPLTSADPEYTYWISYRNKCSSGRSSIRLTVSNKLEYKDPEPAVIACADPVRDTFIYVGHPSTLVASYQWYYQEQAEGSDPVRLEGEIYDTLRLALSTRNTGYYFCSIGEVCNPVTTNSCWFRVDSIPVIGGTLSDTTLCSGSSNRLELSATGGGLTYEWNFLFRNDSTARHEYKNALFSSTGHDLLTNIGVRHDSCRIWCRVWNDCGEAYSDTMLLRVRPLRAATVTPDTVRLYGTDPGSVVISLIGGSAPWTYSYTVNNGPEIKVEEPQWLEDTLSVTVEGHYRLTRLEDPVGCTILSGLPSFEVVRSLQPSAGIKGGGAVCLGGTVSIQVEVRGAKAPCTVYIYRSSDGRPADELPVSNPLVLPASVRDTAFSFAAVSGETYYIQRFEYTDQGGIVREGVITSTRAVVTVSDKIPVRFTPLSSNHIGQCRPIDLLALLKPYIQGSDGTKTPLSLADGKFLLDGRELPDKWWVESALSAGQHEIAYIYGGNSCSLTPEVELVVDTLFGHTVVPQYLCTGGGAEDFELDITGMAPFGVTLRKEWVEYGGVRKPASDLTLTLPSGVYRSPVSFLPEDSCLFYTVTSITDVHGCGVRSGLPLRDTVTQARRSEFSVEVRYPHRSGVAWAPLLLTYNIPSGDSLGVRFTRTAGSGKPWQVYIADNAHPDRLLSELDVYGADTVISLKAALTYLLRPGDGTCGQNPWNDQYLQLRHLDSGHVRVKALLEGAYSSSGRKMFSGIVSELPRYGLADFPASVRDRVIDWIEVEVRRSGGATAAAVASLEGGSWVISRDTCLLLDDGTVVDRSGNDTLSLPHSVSAVGDNSGYLVLRHRNHLSVMSSGVVTLVGSGNKGSVRTVDFTKSANVYSTGSLSQHMTSVGSDVWALSAGEVNTNALISIRDPNIENAGVVPVRGYYLYDVNFDGKVDWPGWKVDSGGNVDWLMVMKNRNKFSEIKFGNEP